MLIFKQAPTETNINNAVRFYNPNYAAGAIPSSSMFFNEIASDGLYYYDTESFELQPNGSYLLRKNKKNFGTVWKNHTPTNFSYLQSGKFYRVNWTEYVDSDKKTITASRYKNNSAYYHPSNCVDEHINSPWAPTENWMTIGETDWWQIDFNEAVDVEQIDLYFSSNQKYPRKYKLSISTTGSFVNIGEYWDLEVTRTVDGVLKSHTISEITLGVHTTLNLKAVKLFFEYTAPNDTFVYLYKVKIFAPAAHDKYLQSFDSIGDTAGDVENTNYGLYILRDSNSNPYVSGIGKLETNFYLYPNKVFNHDPTAVLFSALPHGGVVVCGVFVQFYTYYNTKSNNPVAVVISPHNGVRFNNSNYVISDVWNFKQYGMTSFYTKIHAAGYDSWVWEEFRQKPVTLLEGITLNDVVGSWFNLKVEKIGEILYIYINGIECLQYPIPYPVTGPFGIIGGKGINKWKEDIKVEIPSWSPEVVTNLNQPSTSEEIADLEPTLIFEVPEMAIWTTLSSLVDGTDLLLKDWIKANCVQQIDLTNVRIAVDDNPANDYLANIIENDENDLNTEVYFENFDRVSFTVSKIFTGVTVSNTSRIKFDCWLIGQNVNTEPPMLIDVTIPLAKPKMHFYLENTNPSWEYRDHDKIPIPNRAFGSQYFPRFLSAFSDKIRMSSYPVDSIQSGPMNPFYAIYPMKAESNRGATSTPRNALLQSDSNAYWYMYQSSHYIIIDLGRDFLTWGANIEIQEVFGATPEPIKVEVALDTTDFWSNDSYTTAETILENGKLEYSMNGFYRWKPILGRYIKFTGTWITNTTWQFRFIQIYGQLYSIFEYSDNQLSWNPIPEEGITGNWVFVPKLVRVKIDKSLKLDENFNHNWKVGITI